MTGQEARYRTIVADPPWEMRWTGGATNRKNGRGERHNNHAASNKRLPYPTLTRCEIAWSIGKHVKRLAADDCNLFMWATDGFLLNGTAEWVVGEWGFTNPRILVWQKSGFGLGTFPRPQHEVCLVASRGRSTWTTRSEGSVHRWKLVYEGGARKHSAKPDGFYDLVEQASPGPYLELFARRQRLGWDTWGNEALEHVRVSA